MEFIKETYSVKRGYKILIGQQQVTRVSWDAVVWERLSIPKHRVILWLVFLEKLRTRQMLSIMEW